MQPRNRLLFSAILCLPALLLGAAAISVYSAALWLVGALVLCQFVLAFLLTNYFLPDGGDRSISGAERDDVIEDRLSSLEEIGELFSASLSVRDMFRLLAARASDILPIKGAMFAEFPGSVDSRPARHGEFGEMAAEAAKSLEVEAAEGSDVLTGRSSDAEGPLSIAVFSLRQNGEAFGTVAMVLEDPHEPESETLELLEAVRTRFESAMAGAVSRERGAANSLADPVTGLPNERAFYIVLENRIAEVRRSRGSEGLGVLALDLSDFAEVNRMYGHATGDRVLAHASETLKEHLRAMDFLARSSADEFLVILAKTEAGSEGAVISRLRENVKGRFFKLPNGKGFPINMNAGAAFFGPDGETAPDLLASARRRKDGQKPGKGNQVIQFPTKYSN